MGPEKRVAYNCVSYFSKKTYASEALLMSTNYLQSNLHSLNTDGSFTMANSNLFLSPYDIPPIAQENKYLRKFSYFIMKLYVVCTSKLPHQGNSNTHNIPLLDRRSDFPR